MTTARPNAPLTTLRSWLDRLEETGRLARAKPDVPLEFTLAAIAKRLDGDKATFFPSPGGHALSVISGLVAARPWIAEAMGVDEADMLESYRDAVLKPLPWSEVSADSAPVQQIVIDCDLDITEELPIPVHNEHDAGAYITAGLVIAANPKTGVQNVSINRIQISGPDRRGILILPRDLHRFYDAAEEAGEALSVAIAVGVDPLTLLASQSILPIDRDELEVAGALHGRPLPVVKCKTNDVRVPAEAEIIIEGRLLPGVREEEGPFGEFPQYYGPSGKRQVIEIDTITRREDALFHTIVPAAMEHLLLGGIPREASLIAHLQRTFPSVKDVHLSRGGVCRYHLVVKIAKRWDGEPKNIMMGAFAGSADIKQVTVVDEDVDILDPDAVEWAVATRFQATEDLMVVAGAQGSRLDPSGTDGRVDKMGLDATKPLGGDPFTFTVVHVPGEDDDALDDWIEG